MTVKQVILTISNKPGELARVFSHLYENDVTVSAFWASPEGDTASVRFVANDHESALSALTSLNLEAATSEVIAAKIPNHPGGINAVLKALESEKIDILHMYPCVDTNVPTLILDVDKPQEAENALRANWITVLE